MPGPYGRAPGSLTGVTYSRAATASAALISQRSGPPTASPKGEADATEKICKNHIDMHVLLW